MTVIDKTTPPPLQLLPGIHRLLKCDDFMKLAGVILSCLKYIFSSSIFLASIKPKCYLCLPVPVLFECESAFIFSHVLSINKQND